jgi:hypothetical protein
MQTGQARYSGAFIDLLPTLLNYAGVLNKTVGGPMITAQVVLHEPPLQRHLTSADEVQCVNLQVTGWTVYDVTAPPSSVAVGTHACFADPAHMSLSLIYAAFTSASEVCAGLDLI